MSPIRVLLADDNDIFRHGLRKLLESDARVVVVGEARDGLEVVNLAKRLSPDVILMDIRMPGQDGLAAARAIRACCPETKIIMLTSYDTVILRDKAKKLTIDIYLPKSLSDEAILQQIQMEVL